ncbi:D-aminoacylase [Patescibacteria group bacterium]|nr:D-aminoacylase [Patescibacteria group bacterium]
MHDILIKNGTVIDGSGEPPKKADVAIKDGLIAGIGDFGEQPATIVIQAAGQFVTPGFIDITSHSDVTWSLFDYPGQESMLTQGVTTIIGGNCGTSLAPLASKEALDAMKKYTDVSRINTNWQRMEEFFTELEKHSLGINFGTLLGHGTIRRGIIGSAIRALTQEEIEKMKLMIDEGMEAGAFGFSTGLSFSHESVASSEELISFLKTLNPYHGLYKVHLRSESKDVFSGVNELIRIGRELDIKVHISHLKLLGRKSWDFVENTEAMLTLAEKNGVKLSFDLFPYVRTGSLLYQLLPAWAREGGFEPMIKRIQDPALKTKIIDDLKKLTLHYDAIVIASAEYPYHAGKTIKEISEIGNESPEETILSLLVANHGRVSIFNKTIFSKNLELLIKNPISIIASDGSGYDTTAAKTGNLVHPRSFGTFPHFLHHFVAKKKLVSWENAIQKITSIPANAIGIKNRGLLKQGYAADVTVFNPETIRSRATYANPYLYSEGISAVIVNGVVAIENVALSGKRAGKILKRT